MSAAYLTFVGGICKTGWRPLGVFIEGFQVTIEGMSSPPNKEGE